MAKVLVITKQERHVKMVQGSIMINILKADMLIAIFITVHKAIDPDLASVEMDFLET